MGAVPLSPIPGLFLCLKIMKKYKLNTKIGQCITHIEVNIRSDVDKHRYTVYHKNGIHIKYHKIAYQTDRKIALNNDWITVLDRQKINTKKDSYHHYLEDCNVSIKTKETHFPNGIFGSIYTAGNTKMALKKIGAAMEKDVNSEFGFLCKIDVFELIDEYLENNNSKDPA